MHGPRKRTYVRQCYCLSLSAQLDACAWIMAIFLNNNLNLQLNRHFGNGMMEITVLD